MKRDIDLCRQILLDLEAKSSGCSTSVLRTDATRDGNQRVRYHLRLLIDAGLVHESEHVNGTTTTRVRLTHAGHEFLDVARSEGRWHDAKAVVLHRTGGLSLTVLRNVLTKWAVEVVSTPRRRLRRVVRPSGYRYDPIYAEDYADTEVVREPLEGYIDEEFSVVRSRPDYRERFDTRETVAEVNGYGYTTEAVDSQVGVTLPIYMV